MVKVEKEYAFDGPSGRTTLRDLFDGRSQLIIYHFMFDPSWDEGCKSCSHFADSFDGTLAHLTARDTSFAVVSRAPLTKLESFRRRMGWTFRWLSSVDNDFNYDFHVTLDEAAGSVEYNYASAALLLQQGKIWQMGELPGMSVFLRDGDDVFHTYSTWGTRHHAQRAQGLSRGQSVIQAPRPLELRPVTRLDLRLGKQRGAGRCVVRSSSKVDSHLRRRLFASAASAG